MSMRDLTIESMKLEGYWIELELKDLRAKLAASQERERILREGLEKYADRYHWDARTSIYNDHWKPISNGYDIAETTLKAAEEVK